MEYGLNTEAISYGAMGAVVGGATVAGIAVIVAATVSTSTTMSPAVVLTIHSRWPRWAVRGRSTAAVAPTR